MVDKPSSWTSHDVVNKMRRLSGIQKIGHLGTLDPMATGVLPLMIGRATRLAQFFQRTDKIYEATVRFGFCTDTYDAEGVAVSGEVDVRLDRDQLESMLPSFTGVLSQVPPAVSAKKIAGVPAYKLARQNIPVEMKPVEVEVMALDLNRCEGNCADLTVHCSTGTYVRSIAHDLGQMLGCGAHLAALRRTASGGFLISQAKTMEELAEIAASGKLNEAVVPAAELIPEFPSEPVDAGTAAFIRQGRDFQVSPFRRRGDAKYVKAVTYEGDLVAIGEARLPNLYHPVLVF